eukprot:NODE_130_length_16779_cov_1.687410.p8 type:complete len:261 gc:universal NODE_130_length_16779_cov_1.687410:4898-5680(+)
MSKMNYNKLINLKAMSTHVAFAKQEIEQHKVSMQLKEKLEDYQQFQTEMTCKILNLRQQEEILSLSLDEHVFLVATLDKKRSSASNKEYNEKKKRIELTENIRVLKSQILEIRNELNQLVLHIQEQSHIKNLITQIRSDEGISLVEYVEAQLYLKSILQEALKSHLSKNVSYSLKITSDLEKASSPNLIDNAIEKVEISKSENQSRLIYSLNNICNSLANAVNMDDFALNKEDGFKNALDHIQVTILLMESLLSINEKNK